MRRISRALLSLAALACVSGGLFLLVSFSCDGQGQDLRVADRARTGGLDVTFFVAADTHFGYKDIADANKIQIDHMNRLPGQPYPPGIGGRVGRPRGVLIAGDLTDTGKASEWRQFVAQYGLTGRDALLKYPVYEGTGNHDRWYSGFNTTITRKVRARHGDLYYTWNWGDLHLVCLDEAPTRTALNWLEKVLARIGRERPVVLFMHFPLAGRYSMSNWFGGSDEKARFGRLIQGFNVIGIFHGHFHGTGRYTWQGVDVYNVGSPKHSARSFAAVHVTDDRMTVAEWDWNPWRNAWVWHHSKRINRASKAASQPRPRRAAER